MWQSCTSGCLLIIRHADLFQGINVQLDAIVNDANAVLLSRAYLDSTSHVAAIMGTGTNAAIHMPIKGLGPSKFGGRVMPAPEVATHVLVNTEVSMFGRDIWPKTRWDKMLNERHQLPDFQPLEYMTSGGYMGEIVRLIIVEATEKTRLFGGELPNSLRNFRSVETRTLAQIEQHPSPSLERERKIWDKHHPSINKATFADLTFIHSITQAVTRRSSAFFVAAIHALLAVTSELEESYGHDEQRDHISIGCDGSVINKYPGYIQRCQCLMDDMVRLEGKGRPKVMFETTYEPTVFGAAIGAAVARGEKRRDLVEKHKGKKE